MGEPCFLNSDLKKIQSKFRSHFPLSINKEIMKLGRFPKSVITKSMSKLSKRVQDGFTFVDWNEWKESRNFVSTEVTGMNHKSWLIKHRQLILVRLTNLKTLSRVTKIDAAVYAAGLWAISSIHQMIMVPSLIMKIFSGIWAVSQSFWDQNLVRDLSERKVSNMK